MAMASTQQANKQREGDGDGDGDGEGEDRNWADLHEPLLKLILGRLPMQSYLRAGAVCRWWQQVRKNASEPQHPLLLITTTTSPDPCHSHSHSHSPLVFYSPSESTRYNNIAIQAFLYPDKVINLFIGSSHGWLYMFQRKSERERELNAVLINPLSGSTIISPNCQGLGKFKYQLLLSAPPTDPDSVAVLNLYTGFASWRIRDGAKVWRKHSTVVTGEDNDPIVDAVYCSGRVYGLRRRLRRFAVLHLDTAAVQVLDVDSRCLPLTACPFFWLKTPRSEAHLVESEGQFLLVIASYSRDGTNSVTLQVFRANLDTMAWEVVHSLEDHVLFIGGGGYVSISATRAGVKGNRICYANNYRSPHWCWMEFNLDDGTATYHTITASAPLLWILPILT